MENDINQLHNPMKDHNTLSPVEDVSVAMKAQIGQVRDTALTETARKLISSAWRDSSKNTYAVYLKKYKIFATENKFDYLQPTEIQVANFLSSCFDKGFTYSAIKNARAAISSIIVIDYSDSKILRRIMKGIFQQRPQLKRNYTWDVKQVLDFWKQKYPAKKLPIMELTMKTALLLLLTMSQRQQALFMLDVRNIEIKYDRIIIRFGDPLKMTNPVFHQGEITILAYPKENLSCLALQGVFEKDK